MKLFTVLVLLISLFASSIALNDSDLQTIIKARAVRSYGKRNRLMKKKKSTKAPKKSKAPKKKSSKAPKSVVVGAANETSEGQSLVATKLILPTVAVASVIVAYFL